MSGVEALSFEVKRDRRGWYWRVDGLGINKDGKTRYPTEEAAKLDLILFLVSLAAEFPGLNIIGLEVQ